MDASQLPERHNGEGATAGSVVSLHVATPLRPDVAVFPAATYAAFVALVLAEVAVGASLGDWLFDEVRGAEWMRTLKECNEISDGVLATGACFAWIEQTRAWWNLAGAAAVVVLGLVAMAIAPSLIRRRRGIRPLGGARCEELEARVAAIAATIGIRPPALMLGPLRQRDAFSYGAFGRYSIALPYALTSAANTRVFEGVIRHELAHVRNRDIGFAWLATSIWYIVGPLLAVPVIWSAITLDPSLLPDYAPRAIVIVVVVWAAARNLLRVREWEADLTASRGGAGDLDLVERTVLLATAAATSPWRRFMAAHPSVASRLAVLRAPERVTIIRFGETAVVGLLVGFAMPIVEGAIQSGLMGGETLWAVVASAAIAGAILGSSVGLGVWRNIHAETAARADDAAIRWSSSRVVAASGLATGTLLGEVLSLAHIRIPITNWLTFSDLIPPLTLGAAVVLSASLASVWISGAGRAGIRVVGILLNVAMFGMAWWLAHTMQAALDLFGWDLFVANAAALLGSLGGWPVAGVILLLGVGGLVGLANRQQAAPRWWFVGEEPVPLPGAAGSRFALAVALIGGTGVGLCSAVVSSVGWTASDSARAADAGAAPIDPVILMAAVGAGCWSLGAALSLPADGPVVGLVGGLVAATSGSLGGLVGATSVYLWGATDPVSLLILTVSTALTCSLPLGAVAILVGALAGVFRSAQAIGHIGWRGAVPVASGIAGVLLAGLLVAPTWTLGS